MLVGKYNYNLYYLNICRYDVANLNSEIYEYPLEPKMRTLLRFHYLLKELTHFCHDKSDYGSKHALMVFFELMHLMERADIRQEILKDLDKLLLMHKNNSDQIATHDVEAIQKCFTSLESIKGKFTDTMHDIPFISSIKARFQIPGGTMKFDLPILQVWLDRPFSERCTLLDMILQHFHPLAEGIKIILYYMTKNQNSQSVIANAGFFQISLDPKQKFQLMLIEYQQSSNEIYYPEISGNRHLMTIRFVTPSITEPKSKVVQQNIPFELTFCNLVP